MTENLHLSNNLSLNSIYELLSPSSEYTTPVQKTNYVDELKLCYNSNVAADIKLDVLGAHTHDGTYETKHTYIIPSSSFIHTKLHTDSNYTKLKFTNLSSTLSNVGVQGYTYMNRHTTLPKVSGNHVYNSEKDSVVLVKNINDISSTDVLRNLGNVQRFEWNTETNNLSTTTLPLWNDANSLHIPTSQVAVSVASDSTNDVITTGSGARTLLISGTDSSDVARAETLNLNGVTPVNSSYEYKHINYMSVESVGSSGYNEGNISCYYSSTSNAMGHMDYTKGINSLVNYRVANNTGLEVKQLNLNAHVLTPSVVELRKVDGSDHKEAVVKKLLVNTETNHYSVPINLFFDENESLKIEHKTLNGSAVSGTDNVINLQLECYTHSFST